MTAVATGQRILDGQGHELGPIATFGAQIFVFGAFGHLFLLTGWELMPNATSPALFVGTLGVLVLAPRHVVRRIPVSMLVLSIIGWMLVSATWTDNPEATGRALERDIPLLLGMIIVAGTISLRHLVTALLWLFRVGIGVTLAAVVISPDARVHIDPGGADPLLPGWHGLFPHKTIMASFLIFAMLTILTFDRTKILKWSSLAAIAVLLAGSDSVTGVTGALLAFSVWVWLQLYRNLDVRNSSVFVVSSVSVGLFGLLGIAASLASITGVAGRDLSLTGRTYVWQATLDAIMERPFTGWGFGGLFAEDPVSPRTAELQRAIGFTAHHAHNGFLDLIVQLGLVGLVIFGVLYLTTAIDGISMIRQRPKIGAWIVSLLVVQLYVAVSENAFLGYGWLGIVVMLRVVSLRSVGMELATGVQLVDRLDRFRQPGRHQRVGQAAAGA